VDERSDLMTTETFGPVAPVVRVRSIDEAILRANSLPYGLGACVYTQRLDYAVRCMEELRAGSVWINDPLTDNDAGPFGGMGMSGNARELGPEGLESFRETKHVHLDTKVERKSWWYPYGDAG
jgi:acyl-CoA reductase-like NAD-dependent aldehyde dehydrogenase